MPPAPRYDRPTAPVALRLPEDARRLLDYVVATTGAPSVSDYLRSIIEAHLEALGFTLKEGVHRALPVELPADVLERWSRTPWA